MNNTEIEQPLDCNKKRYRKINLSNYFDKILNDYMKQTGNSVCFMNEISWDLVKKPSEKIKALMERHKVRYAMAYYMDGEYRMIKMYKRSGVKYFFACYSIIPSQAEQKVAYLKRNIIYKRKKLIYSFYYFMGVCAGFTQIVLPCLINYFYRKVRLFFNDIARE